MIDFLVLILSGMMIIGLLYQSIHLPWRKFDRLMERIKK